MQSPCLSPIFHLPGSCGYLWILNVPPIIFLWASAQAETLVCGLLLPYPALFPWLIGNDFPNSGKRTFTSLADLPTLTSHPLCSQLLPPLMSTQNLTCSELVCTSVCGQGLQACLLVLLHCELLSVRTLIQSLHMLLSCNLPPLAQCLARQFLGGSSFIIRNDLESRLVRSPVPSSVLEDIFNVISIR